MLAFISRVGIPDRQNAPPYMCISVFHSNFISCHHPFRFASFFGGEYFFALFPPLSFSLSRASNFFLPTPSISVLSVHISLFSLPVPVRVPPLLSLSLIKKYLFVFYILVAKNPYTQQSNFRRIFDWGSKFA